MLTETEFQESVDGMLSTDRSRNLTLLDSVDVSSHTDDVYANARENSNTCR